MHTSCNQSLADLEREKARLAKEIRKCQIRALRVAVLRDPAAAGGLLALAVARVEKALESNSSVYQLDELLEEAQGYLDGDITDFL